MRCRACGGPTRFAFAKDGAEGRECRACGALSRPELPVDPGERYAGYLPPATLVLPPATRARYREILEELAPFGRAGAMRLLDVGAGAGLFLEVARDAGFVVAGTELSAAAARAAAKKGIPVHVGPVSAAPRPPGGFDAAVSIETLEHVPDPRAFLAEIAAVLRPGGALFLTTPNYASLNRRLLGREWLAISADHLCLFTPTALKRALAASGFAVRRITTRTFLPNEALKRFRRAPARRTGFQPAETAALQTAIASRPALSRAKRAANAVLAATGLGDVLTALAERR